MHNSSGLECGPPCFGVRAMVQERPVRVERRLSAILAADVPMTSLATASTSPRG
jgi:hypothetical protein